MRDDDARLLDMLLACRAAQRFVEGMTRDQFLVDEKTQASVCLKLEVLGEAARLVSDSFKQVHTEIAWPGIVGLRHRIVHEYFRLDLKVIWRIVQNDLPDLVRLLEPLIPPDTAT
jgi:uncharacterized protein with HEPN domain